MDTLSCLATGFGAAVAPINLLLAAIGAVVGTIVGVLSGLGPIMPRPAAGIFTDPDGGQLYRL
jgi:TctA family transporter